MAKLRCGLRTVLLMAMGLSWFPVAWADLNDGLIAHYPFNGNANDASGNGNHGTVNGATLTEDRFGNADSAYKFDGQDDYIDLGQVKTNISSKFSISAEIKALRKAEPLVIFPENLDFILPTYKERGRVVLLLEILAVEKLLMTTPFIIL